MTVPVCLIARTERVLTELSMLIGENTRFSTESLEDVGEVIPGPGPCSFSTRRISWVAEDELQEEDYLGK